MSSQKEVGNLANIVPGTKSLDGRPATLSVTLPAAVGDGGLNCAEVGIQGSSEVIVFPLTTKVEPAPVPTVTPAPAAAPAQPAPAALSIAKAKKPLKLKVEKWATVKVKVTNNGGSASSPGSLQLKATKGAVVKGGRQKLPILAPGGSWTVSYKVKLTAKARKSSSLALVGAAGSISAKGSLVVKSLG